MRHASYPAATTATHEAAARDQKTKRRSIFTSVLEALHDSRRRQALRILRQYHHLIAQPKEGSPHNLIPKIEAINMMMNEEFSHGKLSARLPVPSEKALITIIAIAFLFLHILAGMIMQRAAADRTVTPQEQSRPSLYD